MEVENLDVQRVAERASSIMHESDSCAHLFGIQIDSVAPGQSQVSMTVKSEFANGHGYCQGGIITTLADTAFAHACNSYNEITVGQGISIDFLRSVKVGERLKAVANEEHRGRLTGLYQIKVLNSESKLVAVMSGKSFSRGQKYFED